MAKSDNSDDAYLALNATRNNGSVKVGGTAIRNRKELIEALQAAESDENQATALIDAAVAKAEERFTNVVSAIEAAQDDASEEMTKAVDGAVENITEALKARDLKGAEDLVSKLGEVLSGARMATKTSGENFGTALSDFLKDVKQERAAMRKENESAITAIIKLLNEELGAMKSAAPTPAQPDRKPWSGTVEVIARDEYGNPTFKVSAD